MSLLVCHLPMMFEYVIVVDSKIIVLSYLVMLFFFFQAEDGIRDLVRSRGLGDVYKRQVTITNSKSKFFWMKYKFRKTFGRNSSFSSESICSCLLYTSDAADERSSVDLGGRRIIKKKNNKDLIRVRSVLDNYQHTIHNKTR